MTTNLKLKCPHCDLAFDDDDDDSYATHVANHKIANDARRIEGMTIREAIKEIVVNKQGCKTLELIAAIPPEHIVKTEANTPEIIQHMIDKGELVEIEYVLPKLPIRIKSFLLPAGTVITFHTPAKYNA